MPAAEGAWRPQKQTARKKLTKAPECHPPAVGASRTTAARHSAARYFHPAAASSVRKTAAMTGRFFRIFLMAHAPFSRLPQTMQPGGGACALLFSLSVCFYSIFYSIISQNTAAVHRKSVGGRIYNRPPFCYTYSIPKVFLPMLTRKYGNLNCRKNR